jgi:hypothetical protein
LIRESQILDAIDIPRDSGVVDVDVHTDGGVRVDDVVQRGARVGLANFVAQRFG